MIITKAPFRMSFFGGGTDYPPFFNKFGGSVLSTTFDKYAYVTIRHLPHFFQYKTKLSYSTIEKVNTIEEIKHPLIRESMRYLNMHNLHITYDADLPARSGLGSSSSFAAALLGGLHALKGQYISDEELAKESIYIERTMCAEDGGWQDQVAACYGGLNRINFTENNFEVLPLIMSESRKQELNNNLMLFFTGFTRFSSEIAKEQVKVISNKDKEEQLLQMKKLVDEAECILRSNSTDLDDFGRMIDYAWKLKRGLTDKISTSELDEIYTKAINAGALGGKLLGAGGGGFFVFYVPKENQMKVLKTLDKLMYIPFKFESSGMQVLHYTPEYYEENL